MWGLNWLIKEYFKHGGSQNKIQFWHTGSLPYHQNSEWVRKTKNTRLADVWFYSKVLEIWSYLVLSKTSMKTFVPCQRSLIFGPVQNHLTWGQIYLRTFWNVLNILHENKGDFQPGKLKQEYRSCYCTTQGYSQYF